MVRGCVLRSYRKSTTAVALLAVLWATAFFSPANAQDVDPAITAALNSGDTASAVELLKGRIDYDPGYYANYFLLGRVYYEQERYAGAVEQFGKALDLKATSYDALYYQGMSQLALNDLDAAAETFDRGRKKDKKEKHRFEDGYGLVMMAKKDFQEADRSFRQALVDQPDNSLYHIHLGDANFFQGVPSLAVTEYEKALQADSGSTEVYFHWAEACLEMRDYPCAIEKLRLVLQKDSTHARAWNRAGGIYFKAALSSRTREDRSERFKDAIGSYKKYIELSGAKPDSQNVRPYFELAMAYVNLGGSEEAAQYFEQVLAIPFEARDIYFNYGKALWGLKQWDRAEEILLKHLDWVSRQDEDYKSSVSESEVYRYLGDACYYRESRKYRDAISYYQKSLQTEPDQKRLLQNIAVGYHTLKSYSQALDYYQQRVALGVDSAGASIYKNAASAALQIAYNQSGGAGEEFEDEFAGDEAVADGVEAMPASATDPNINYFQVAVNFMLEYLKYFPRDEGTLENTANTYLYRLNDCANGVAYYEKVIEVNPKNCGARKSLGYAYFSDQCSKNFDKAIRYLTEAHSCLTAEKGECGDPALTLWVAQAYHLRAAEKTARGESGAADFEAAFNWYGRVLKCEPGNSDAKKGQSDTKFEF